MALAMVLPTMAAPYSLTVTTDQTSYAQGATVAITGALTDAATPAAGLLVGIKVTDPLGNDAYTTIVTTDAQGAYSTSFSSVLGEAQPAGTYTVQATASQNGNQIATTSTTYTVTGAVTVVPKITLSPNTGLATTIVGEGFTAADTITITWGTTTMVTNPLTVSVSSSGSFVAQVTALNQTIPDAYVVKAVDQHGNSANATFTVPSIQGAPGQKGDTGTPGTPGTNGSNGSNGADGATGPVGPSGAPGQKGDAGDVTNTSDIPLTALALAVVALIVGLVAAFIAFTLRRKIAS
jgi:hypothetical protein